MSSPTTRFVTNINTVAGYSLKTWMAHLTRDAQLSQLSIPGTHDSGAYSSGSDSVITQTQTLEEQLASGIRFLDIRGKHMFDQLTVFHGVWNLNLPFADVQEKCQQFLQTNSSECIVMVLKKEGDPEQVTRSYEETFNSYVSQAPGLWYLEDRIPSMKEVRGKIVLLRRFPAETTPMGIDCTDWPDDDTKTFTDPGGVTLCVQDDFWVKTIFNLGDKWDKVETILDQAAAGNQDWYINFTSGAIGAFPKDIAKGISGIDGINTRLNSYLASHSQARYGTIPMDFPEYPGELVSRIISMNDLANCWSLPLNIKSQNQAASMFGPALSAFNGKLQMAFLDSNASKSDLWTCSSISPLLWGPCLNMTQKNNAASSNEPALAELNGKLFMAFMDSHPTDASVLKKYNLWACSSPNGNDWSPCTNITHANNALTKTRPALASFNGKVYMAFLDSDATKPDIWICSSTDGVGWSQPINVTSQNHAASRGVPALAAFKGKLHLAFLDSNPSKTDLWICSTADGIIWQECVNITQQNHAASKLPPALAAMSSSMCMAFMDDKEGSTDLWVCTSYDGSVWSPCANVTGQNRAMTRSSPALAFANSRLYMAYVDSNAMRTDLWLCSVDPIF